jgi:hypothetical protein
MRDWVDGDAGEFWTAAADRLRGSGLFSRDGVAWVAQAAPEPSPSTMGRWLISMLSVQLDGSPALEAA